MPDTLSTDLASAAVVDRAVRRASGLVKWTKYDDDVIPAWVAEHDHRDARGVEGGRPVAGGIDRHLGLGGRLVGQRRTVREVTDGEHPVGGPPLLVDQDQAPFIQGSAGLADPDRVAVGSTPHDHAYPVGVKHQVAVGSRDGQPVVVHPGRRVPEAQPDAEVAQPPLHGPADPLPEAGKDAVFGLDDRDSAPQLGERTGQLDTDVTAADEDELVGKLGAEQQFSRSHDPLAVEREPRKLDRT